MRLRICLRGSTQSGFSGDAVECGADHAKFTVSVSTRTTHSLLFDLFSVENQQNQTVSC